MIGDLIMINKIDKWKLSFVGSFIYIICLEYFYLGVLTNLGIFTGLRNGLSGLS